MLMKTRKNLEREAAPQYLKLMFQLWCRDFFMARELPHVGEICWSISLDQLRLSALWKTINYRFSVGRFRGGVGIQNPWGCSQNWCLKAYHKLISLKTSNFLCIFRVCTKIFKCDYLWASSAVLFSSCCDSAKKCSTWEQTKHLFPLFSHVSSAWYTTTEN